MPRYIFITGGVVSSLGKGLGAAALASLLQARGYSVRLRKLDPYLNVDPGTMSPTQHGEVFVTDDGAETDLDLGHYERFTGVHAKRTDNVTTDVSIQMFWPKSGAATILAPPFRSFRMSPMRSRHLFYPTMMMKISSFVKSVERLVISNHYPFLRPSGKLAMSLAANQPVICMSH
jgi:hypothetical protein